jgi:hypothetical protein
VGVERRPTVTQRKRFIVRKLYWHWFAVIDQKLNATAYAAPSKGEAQAWAAEANQYVAKGQNVVRS